MRPQHPLSCVIFSLRYWRFPFLRFPIAVRNPRLRRGKPCSCIIPSKTASGRQTAATIFLFSTTSALLSANKACSRSARPTYSIRRFLSGFPAIVPTPNHPCNGASALPPTGFGNCKYSYHQIQWIALMRNPCGMRRSGKWHFRYQ